ncbi:hypothetical protein CONPUDRAFT_146979 [Coniophora puteana RWD-64-598 SS2]|uniref:Uncharacterized protein n=1 Tax=Coniophora puteana (strain RWD-64-598) TaxID=741705 RepID=A0A5M3MAB9_CONPW|nr:uncharacterized protein CONPUDRAFT_146979 [Coniophora puteana RWD-64-598 SS2]EIW75896.1 hypothetical protein CONPUDRAFT_146979 [Coniophora puteana RWD-64-598 SS2]
MCLNAHLPPELLVVIFEECAALSHIDQNPWQIHTCWRACLQDWICVTHVCRHWRMAALTCSALWSRPPLTSSQWTREFLSRTTAITPLIVSGCVLNDPSSAASWVTDNLRRIRELVIKTTTDALCVILSEIGRQQTLSLESLSIINAEDAGGWLGNILPTDTRLGNACKLTRLHLSNLFFSLPRGFLNNLQNLRELSLIETICCLNEEDRRNGICLPRLRRLHVTDTLDVCQEFMSTLQLLNPLEYFGLEDDYSQLLSSIFMPVVCDLLSFDAIGHDSEVELPLPLDGYHAALGVDLQPSHCSHQSIQFHFEAGKYDAMDDTCICVLCRRVLSRVDKEGNTANNLTAVSENHPGLYTSGILRSDIGQFVSAMSASLSLDCVVYLHILNRARWTVTAADFSNIFNAMPRLRSLSVCHIQLPALTQALAPHQQQEHPTELPIPSLRKLALGVVDFSAERNGATSGMSLAACLSSRAGYGAPLETLSLLACMNLDEDEEYTKGLEVTVTTHSYNIYFTRWRDLGLFILSTPGRREVTPGFSIVRPVLGYTLNNQQTQREKTDSISTHQEISTRNIPSKTEPIGPGRISYYERHSPLRKQKHQRSNPSRRNYGEQDRDAMVHNRDGASCAWSWLLWAHKVETPFEKLCNVIDYLIVYGIYPTECISE